jgi:hypothetical protein
MAGEHTDTPERVLLFVCAHGASKSRMAAALFNAAAPPGWRATSAGLHPAEAINAQAARLMADTPAAGHFDANPPRAVEAVNGPARMVGIDCDVAGGERWDLTQAQIAEPMREEIRARVAQLVGALDGR